MDGKSPVYKLETQESDSASQYKSEGLGTRSSDVRGQENYINICIYFLSVF